MSKERLGIGFVGSGFVAQFHIRSLVSVRDADVAGVMSPTREHAEAAAALGALLGPFQQVEDSITDAIESMLSGAASPDEAMAAAVDASNAAIKEYNDRLGR